MLLTGFAIAVRSYYFNFVLAMMNKPKGRYLMNAIKERDTMFSKRLKLILVVLTICGVVFTGCKKDKDNGVGPDNRQPLLPSDPVPSDAATDIASLTDLSWTCSDLDGDSLTYDIYLGTSETLGPNELVSSDQAETSYHLELIHYTTYYWKIVAKDDHAHETEGPVWSFTVTGIEPGTEREFDLGNSGETITMVWIPDGTFMMGALDNESGADYDERPRHQVTISEGFWMGKYEVTQVQWESVTGYENFGFDGYPNRPAENVSFNDIVNDFLPELGSGWRLPTEAEWEYASRGGVENEWFWFGSSYDDIDLYSWYGIEDSPAKNSDDRTHEVGSKLPNPWGLYDMHGNVYEFCSDWFAYDYYNSSPPIDPQGPSVGERKLTKGGSWYSTPRTSRSANRRSSFVTNVNEAIGFRLVRESD